MWPYNESEAEWLNSISAEPQDITPEMLNAYIRKAHRMRSEAVANALSGAARTVKRTVKAVFRPAQPDHDAGTAHLPFGTAFRPK